jgi:hypothetical protein
MPYQAENATGEQMEPTGAHQRPLGHEPQGLGSIGRRTGFDPSWVQPGGRSPIHSFAPADYRADGERTSIDTAAEQSAVTFARVERVSEVSQLCGAGRRSRSRIGLEVCVSQARRSVSCR